jgi:hypothetical protein
MGIHKQAAVETVKSVAVLFAAGVVFYFLLSILGPKLGLLFMLVSMIGWFTWLTYSFYVDKFTMQDKFKL